MTLMDCYLCNNVSESLEHIFNFLVMWLGCLSNLAVISLLLFWVKENGYKGDNEYGFSI